MRKFLYWLSFTTLLCGMFWIVSWLERTKVIVNDPAINVWDVVGPLAMFAVVIGFMIVGGWLVGRKDERHE